MTTNLRSKRRQNFQSIAWFLDLYRRKLINLDPPFQRRSVWNDTYREEFIDTILLQYPAPAIFLFSRIDESGMTTYDLVDGKQRLTTVFRFLNDEFPVGAKSPEESLRGRYFSSFSAELKLAVYEYDFSVEYLPTNNVGLINDIFNRMNRNTVKLTAQELRHARFSGPFIRAAEELSIWMQGQLGKSVPRVTEQLRSQMKDVEIVAILLLLLEEGPRGYSALELDEAFAIRDDEWERQDEIIALFRSTIEWMARFDGHATVLVLPPFQTRLRYQADFYSFFGAIAELIREGRTPEDLTVVAHQLLGFIGKVDDEEERRKTKEMSRYYEAARSASSDPGPRKDRIAIIRKVLTGQSLTPIDT
jgi:hypothetical protein